MTKPDPVTVDARTSPPAQPIPAADLAAPAPSVVLGQSAPQEAPDVGITNDELARMTIDLVAGRPVRPSTPYAAGVLERLRAEIAALPPGAIVELPPDNP